MRRAPSRPGDARQSASFCSIKSCVIEEGDDSLVSPLCSESRRRATQRTKLLVPQLEKGSPAAVRPAVKVERCRSPLCDEQIVAELPVDGSKEGGADLRDKDELLIAVDRGDDAEEEDRALKDACVHWSAC
jgi:hypothetical protein